MVIPLRKRKICEDCKELIYNKQLSAKYCKSCYRKRTVKRSREYGAAYRIRKNLEVKVI